MKIHNLEQGSKEWLAERGKYNTASEAPAMMGVSPYLSRSELLHTKYSGETKKISAATQRVFDNGHAAEAACRPAIEKLIGGDLFPCMITDDDGWLSASLDGMTLKRDIVWEHKQFNKAKISYMQSEKRVPEQDFYQVQQALLLSGAEKAIYSVGNDPDDMEVLEALPDPDAFQAIVNGWKQFDADLESYEPEEATAEAVGNTMESLPALRIELSGMVKASNLSAYKDHAMAVFNSISTTLETDQDFADAENTVKWCKDVEDRLDAAKTAALAQTEDIEALFRTLDDLKESARQKRLELDKLVKARKAAVRDDIRRAAGKALDDHLAALNDRLDGRVKVPQPEADFANAMKNKRTIASLKDAVDQVLADAKIESSANADAIQANLKIFDELAGGNTNLFPDLAGLVHKQPDDFVATIKLRIVEQQERNERIRKEAEEKAEREAAEALRAKEALDECSEPPAVEEKVEQPPTKPTEQPSLEVRATELENQARVHSAIVRDLSKSVNCSPELAKKIVIAVVKGKIPNLSIDYFL